MHSSPVAVAVKYIGLITPNWSNSRTGRGVSKVASRGSDRIRRRETTAFRICRMRMKSTATGRANCHCRLQSLLSDDLIPISAGFLREVALAKWKKGLSCNLHRRKLENALKNGSYLIHCSLQYLSEFFLSLCQELVNCSTNLLSRYTYTY